MTNAMITYSVEGTNKRIVNSTNRNIKNVIFIFLCNIEFENPFLIF